MGKRFRVAAIQLNSQADVAANVRAITRAIRRAADRNAQFVALPENALYSGPDANRTFAADDPALLTLRGLARTHRLWLLIGSIQEPGPRPRTKYNTSLLLDPRGRVTARYRKLHLFRCRMPDGSRFRERQTLPGAHLATARIGPFRAGLTICYDVRFPELYGLLARQGARLFCVPANFTAHTGAAHWHTLLRARAIENQAYVVAPGQCGQKHNMDSFGHSLIIDPWGTILAEASAARPEIVYADLCPQHPRHLRTHLPAITDRHARWTVGMRK